MENRIDKKLVIKVFPIVVSAQFKVEIMIFSNQGSQYDYVDSFCCDQKINN